MPSKAGSTDVPFVCAACGHRATGTVPDVPREKAAALVAIAPCPKCGERNDEAVRPILRDRIFPALSWGLLCGLVGTVATCMVRRDADSFDAIGGAIVSAIVAICVFVVPVQKQLGATRVVRWREGDDLTPAAARPAPSGATP